MKIAFLLLITAVLAGCTTPPKTKADLRTMPIGPAEHLRGEYAAIAKYWDEHAVKQSVDGANVTSLDIQPGIAQINAQGIVPYVLIELKDDGVGGTDVQAYAWDGGRAWAERWLKTIRETQKPQTTPTNSHDAL
jgi:hypothetical protein